MTISQRAVLLFFILSNLLVMPKCVALPDSTSSETSKPNDAEIIWNNAGRIFTAPVHFTSRDWIITGTILGGTALLFTVDESAQDRAERFQSSTADDFFEVGRQYGREVYGLALAGGCYIGGVTLKNDDLRETGVMVFESIAFAGIATTVLKTIIGRSRPFVNEGPYKFHGFSFENENNSLPSGHSTVAFAVSSVLAERIHNTYATIGLYSLATLTAFSRIYHDQHWLSDTFLGAAIGTVSGLSVTKFHTESDHSMSLVIIPSTRSIAISVIF